jgi:hypothetical protein
LVNWYGVSGLLENAPTSFLNLFPEHLGESKLGLYAETLVSAGRFHSLRNHTGVKEAFAAKQDIDLIVTATGDFDDPDDLLSAHLTPFTSALKPA